MDAASDAFFPGRRKTSQPLVPQNAAAQSQPGSPGGSRRRLAARKPAIGPVDASTRGLRTAEFEPETRPGSWLVHGDSPDRPLPFLAQPDRHPPRPSAVPSSSAPALPAAPAPTALAAAGWQVTVLEQASEPATGASGNLAGVLRPLPSADDNRLSRLTRAGYLATRALLGRRPMPAGRPAACCTWGANRSTKRSSDAPSSNWAGRLKCCSSSSAKPLPTNSAGRSIPAAGGSRTAAGCSLPRSTTRRASAFPEHLTVRYFTPVDRLQPNRQRLAGPRRRRQRAGRSAGRRHGQWPRRARFEQFAWLPQRAARSQVSHLPADAPPLEYVVVCKLGYAIPAIDGLRLIGATLQSDDTDPIRAIDHQENLAPPPQPARLRAGIDPATLAGRVGFRPMSPDRLPSSARCPTRHGQPEHPPAQPAAPARPVVRAGLWRRGIVWSALMADLLVSRLEGEPLPLESDLVDACDPGRFLLKAARRRNLAEIRTTGPEQPALRAC